MSITRENTSTNNKTYQKGSGLDVHIGNPGMINTVVSPQQPDNDKFRGSFSESIVTGTNETFNARANLLGNDYDVISFFVANPATKAPMTIFVADQDYQVVSFNGRINTLGGTGFTATLTKTDDGASLVAGTSVSSAIDISSTSTANTSISGTIDEDERYIQSGQALGVVYAGTGGSAANLTYTLVVRRMLAPERQASFSE